MQLKILILSFNEIKKIENLGSCIKLRKVDLNHNFIQKIESLDELKDLKCLDLGNNWVSELNSLDGLFTAGVQIQEINLKCNPVASKKSYRSDVFRKVPSLMKLDSISINEKDKETIRGDSNEITRELL